MPREVSSGRAAAGFGCTWSCASLATMFGSRMRMRCRMLRSKQNDEFIAGPADVAGADGENGVSGTRLLQQVFDAFLHGAKIVDVLLTAFPNGPPTGFPSPTRAGRF